MPSRLGPRFEEGMACGPYRLLKLVGRGAQGEVWSGKLTVGNQLARLVALKIAYRLGSELANEHRVAARLQHPNLVRVFAMGEEQGCEYLAIEWLSGGTLERRLHRSALSPRAVVEIGYALADALAAVHEAGFVHRDVKPANVLFGDGTPKHGSETLKAPLARSTWR